MLKQKNHRLLFPPRYARGDPRNNERMRIVSSLDRMVRLYDKILRRKNCLIVKGENNGA
ncbi:hypothetical protein ES705_11436 [subsurface metagenome]